MPDINYFGSYARFDTESKDDGAAFLGPDNVVGDAFSIEPEAVSGKTTFWLVNPFGKRMGYIDKKSGNQFMLCQAKGMTTVALLSFVAFSSQPDEGHYWGEVALISYDPHYEQAFSTFVDGIGKMLGNGIRPDLKLGRQAIGEIVESGGKYQPTGRVPLPPKQKGTALIKTQKSPTERLITQARRGNIGCTIVGWAFILVLVALIVFAAHSFGLF